MTYMGEGLYSYTFKNVPAANYEYKITMGDWSENYGAGGVISGSNIAVTVTEPQDVTIYYSDSAIIQNAVLIISSGQACYCREQGFRWIQNFLTAD